MADRKGPESGYDFGNKAQYRRNIWGTFRDKARLQGHPTAECRALLMPSIEGREIDVAKSAGFRESNLYVVDKNPAIVATLKRRYPFINTHGVTVARAAGRIASGGKLLQFANLDLCGMASPAMQRELRSFVDSGCLGAISYVAVTMLRGRESVATSDYMRAVAASNVVASTHSSWVRALGNLQGSDLSRALFVGASLSSRCANYRTLLFPIRGEVYKSTAGTQTMLWSMWQVVAAQPSALSDTDALLSGSIFG